MAEKLVRDKILEIIRGAGKDPVIRVATGVAISSLSGATATNTALAWLV